jgi:hypothetical protein
MGLITAFFIDLDHLFDYFLYAGFRFDLIEFLTGGYFAITQKVFVPLHSWELVAVIGIFWLFIEDKCKYSWVLFLFIGYFVHLAFDVYSNSFSWESYFLFNRMKYDFSVSLFH